MICVLTHWLRGPKERTVSRQIAVGLTAIAVFVAAGAARVDPDESASKDRIDRLVRQLGHRSFAKREEASRELAAIGESARPALTKAAADPDAEVGCRSRQVLDVLDARALAAAARKELARWEGEWT